MADRSARSARQLLLFGGRGERRDGEPAYLASELASIESGACGGPVARAQLEVPIARPVREHTEEVAQVGLGIEAVKAGRGDEREEVRCALGVVVTADKEPGLATDRDAAQLALAAIVVHDEAAVLEIAHERVLLPDHVTERPAEQATLAEDVLVFRLGPREEGLELRARELLAQRLDLDGGPALPLALEGEEPPDAGEPLPGDDALGDGGLPDPAARVAPAADLAAQRAVGVGGGRRGLRRTEQRVVDALRVGLDVAGEALEERPHGRAWPARPILQEDRLTVDDLD